VDYDAINPVVFSQHIQPIFTASCNTAACHNNIDNAAGLRLTSYLALTQGSTFGSQVIPFRADRSHLYLQMTGDIEPLMPLALPPLSDSALRMFKRWIDAGAPDDDGSVMYSDVTRKAFVACQGEDAIAVLDLDTNLFIRIISVDKPHSVYVDATNDRVYVTRFETANDNIQVFDANTYAPLNTGRGGTYPALLGIAPGTNQLWVTNFDATGSDHRVRVFDPETLVEAHNFSLPVLQPHGLAFSQDGARVYVTNIGSSDVSIFQTNPPDVLVASIHLPGGEGQQPQQCALSTDGSRLYVSALGSNKVHVMSTVTEAFLPGSVDVGTGPWHLTVVPQTNELWVANWAEQSVSVLSLANPDAPVEVARLAPQHPLDPSRPAFVKPIGISLLPGSNLVYVANSNDDGSGQGHHPPPGGQASPGSVAVVNVTNRTVLAVEEVPNFARFVSFLP
jgi:DNA-binding beta-propeller fold protein YncE